MRKRKSLLTRFLRWRVKHISNKNFLLILSILTGLFTGVAGVILKDTAHAIKWFLTLGFFTDYHHYSYFAFPLVGILLVILFVKFILQKHVGHGIPTTLYAISKKRSIMLPYQMFSALISSSITVGFGGSVGLEGPTISTGAAISSNLGRILHIGYKQRTLLIGCAGAGAMASIFNSPIAAVVFSLEVLMLDLTSTSLIALVLASVSATITSRLYYGDDVLFQYKYIDHLELGNIPYYILFGIVAGLTSLYFAKTYLYIEQKMSFLKTWYAKWLVGSILLGILLFLFPPLYGEGYDTINILMKGRHEILFAGTLFQNYASNFFAVAFFLLSLILFKILATSLTFGAGGIGGVFAPTLFMGSITGYLFISVINHFSAIDLSHSNFTLLGMGGLIAGVLHAPLTAVFLIAEITRGYDLFIPLMISSTISYLTVKYFLPNSVYTHQLAKRGELITHHKDKAVLSMMDLNKVIEYDLKVISADLSLGELVKIIAVCKRNIFPVVNEERELLGVLLLDDIRQVMFNPSMYEKTYVRDYMIIPPDQIVPNEPMDSIVTKFEQTGAWNLPVCDNGKYVGFISKSKLFSAYRKLLKNFSDD